MKGLIIQFQGMYRPGHISFVQYYNLNFNLTRYCRLSTSLALQTDSVAQCHHHWITHHTVTWISSSFLEWSLDLPTWINLVIGISVCQPPARTDAGQSYSGWAPPAAPAAVLPANRPGTAERPPPWPVFPSNSVCFHFFFFFEFALCSGPVTAGSAI